MLICTLENVTLPTKTMVVNGPGTLHINSSLEIVKGLETWWQMLQRVIHIYFIHVCLFSSLSLFLSSSFLPLSFPVFIFSFFISL